MNKHYCYLTIVTFLIILFISNFLIYQNEAYAISPAGFSTKAKSVGQKIKQTTKKVRSTVSQVKKGSQIAKKVVAEVAKHLPTVLDRVLVRSHPGAIALEIVRCEYLSAPLREFIDNFQAPKDLATAAIFAGVVLFTVQARLVLMADVNRFNRNVTISNHFDADYDGFNDRQADQPYNQYLDPYRSDLQDTIARPGPRADAKPHLIVSYAGKNTAIVADDCKIINFVAATFPYAVHVCAEEQEDGWFCANGVFCVQRFPFEINPALWFNAVGIPGGGDYKESPTIPCTEEDRDDGHPECTGPISCESTFAKSEDCQNQCSESSFLEEQADRCKSSCINADGTENTNCVASCEAHKEEDRCINVCKSTYSCLDHKNNPAYKGNCIPTPGATVKLPSPPEYLSLACTQDLPIMPNYAMTARATRCISETFTNMIYGLKQRVENGRVVNYCNYEVGEYSDITLTTNGDSCDHERLGGSFLQKMQSYFSSYVKACLILYIVILSLKMVAFQQFPSGLEVVKFFFIEIIKFGLVLYFALGNGWKDGYMDALFTSSYKVAGILTDASTKSFKAENHDECNFSAEGNSPTGIAYAEDPTNGTYAALDTADCKIKNYFGYYQDVSLADEHNIAFPALAIFIITFLFVPFLGPFIFGLAFTYIIIPLIGIIFNFVFPLIQNIMIMTLLIFISPFFIPMLLFSQTKGYFDAWLKMLISHSLIPAFIIICFLFILMILGNGFYGTDAVFTDQGLVDPDNCPISRITCLYVKHQSAVSGNGWGYGTKNFVLGLKLPYVSPAILAILPFSLFMLVIYVQICSMLFSTLLQTMYQITGASLDSIDISKSNPVKGMESALTGLGKISKQFAKRGASSIGNRAKNAYNKGKYESDKSNESKAKPRSQSSSVGSSPTPQAVAEPYKSKSNESKAKPRSQSSSVGSSPTPQAVAEPYKSKSNEAESKSSPTLKQASEPQTATTSDAPEPQTATTSDAPEPQTATTSDAPESQTATTGGAPEPQTATTGEALEPQTATTGGESGSGFGNRTRARSAGSMVKSKSNLGDRTRAKSAGSKRPSTPSTPSHAQARYVLDPQRKKAKEELMSYAKTDQERKTIQRSASLTEKDFDNVRKMLEESKATTNEEVKDVFGSYIKDKIANKDKK